MDLKIIDYKIFFVIFLINLTTISVRSAATESRNTTLNSSLPFDQKMIIFSKSADIKGYMDTDIDPCTDFYSFSCGHWKNINPAQIYGEINTDKFGAITKGLQKKLHDLLQKPKTGKGQVEDKIKDFYQSCKKIKTDNAQYKSAMKNVYKEFGQFSALKSEEELKKSNEFQWWSTIAKIHNKYGKSLILSIDILDDLKNNSRVMLYLGTPSFDLTQNAVNIMHAMQEAKIKMFLKSIFGIENEQALKMAKEIIQFEKDLSMGATDARSGKSINDLLNLYNTTDLKAKYNDLFDIEKFLEIALGTKDLPQQVYVYDESYLENLYEVFNATDNQIVENYILWLLLEEYIVDYTDNDLDETCTDKSKKYFGQFIDNVIYKQYRTKEAESEIYELWGDIKSQFRQDLQSDKYYWMSSESREYAVEKLDNMNLTINSYDNDDFEKFFLNLNIDSSNYVVNVQNILIHAEALRGNKLEKKPEGIDDAEVLSYTPVYNIFENKIKLPIALLQLRFMWDPIYPKAIKYGTLGYLIAHEMIHGFDDEGRNYGPDGSALNWWDEKSEFEFESRRKCFQEQYHNYIYAGKHLPDSAQQSENIADNAGVKLAYRAYTRWLNKQKKDSVDVEANETLPRLEYNNRELFFISFAQVWCEDTQSFFKSSFASSDSHAPSMFRVIGPLSNFHEFSWIWKCKEGARMVPATKCEIY